MKNDLNLVPATCLLNLNKSLHYHYYMLLRRRPCTCVGRIRPRKLPRLPGYKPVSLWPWISKKKGSTEKPVKLLRPGIETETETEVCSPYSRTLSCTSTFLFVSSPSEAEAHSRLLEERTRFKSLFVRKLTRHSR